MVLTCTKRYTSPSQSQREGKMKNLYVMRHGPAGKAEKLQLEDDSERSLTKKGKKVTRDVAKGMLDWGVELDVILTGTYARAAESARVVAKVYGMKNKIVELESVTPDGPVSNLIEDIKANTGDANNILLVGHAPQVNRLVSSMVSGFKHADIELKKGGLCHLTFETLGNGKCAKLQFLMPRRFLVRSM
jgi:phosphohistidine phosphatase